MGVVDRVRKWAIASPQARWERSSWPSLGIDAWLQQMGFGGNLYGLVRQTLGGSGGQAEIASDYGGLASAAYKANGIIFALMLTRMMVFTEARFQWRQFNQGRPGDLFGNRDLGILERPWPNGQTGDLLARMIQDVDLGGNFYAYNETPERICRMRPDWVTLVLGSQMEPLHPGWQLDAEIAGYLYHPGGRGSGQKAIPLLREDVAHWMPIPDPESRYMGMSWITPIIREVMADQAASEHKLRFFDNGATPNMIVSFAPDISPEDFDLWREAASERSEGAENAYRTLYLGGGATATVVGANLRQLDFKAVQGAGETRIAAAARVPPIIAGFSEGLASGSFANYSQARRSFADGMLRPSWRSAAAALEPIVKVPAGAHLWYDERDIAFLREDVRDAAAIQLIRAQTIRTLVDGGYEPDAVIQAVMSDDFTKLVKSHTGLFSVQLQPPGTVATPPAVPPPNGSASLLPPGAVRELPSGERPLAILAILEQFTAKPDDVVDIGGS